MPLKIAAAMAFGLLLASSSPVFAAKDIELPLGYAQAEFEDLSRQVGLAISYTPLAPAAPLGLLGFDIGVAFTVVSIDSNEAYWKNAIGGASPPSILVFPKLHAQKGLPLGFDVGLIFAKAPGTNIGLIGGELKWAILKGTLATPAVAIRGSHTKLTGVDDLDIKVSGVDISISKGFAMLTPYAGVGKVWISSEETSDLITPDLDKVSLSETKSFIGIKLSLFVMSFVAEAGFSDVPSYSGRINLSF